MNDMLRTGKRLIGTMLGEIYFPNIPYIYKNCGYDFFIIDCEHGAFDYSQVSATISVARLAGVKAIVRIPEIRREHIIKYLDMGADGLLAPMVRNSGDAELFAGYAKYPPEGCRGVSINRAHSMYNPGDMNKYVRRANERTMLFVQIELKEALDSLESIAAVRGIDGLIVGPSDLSMDLGIFNRLDDPSLLDAVENTARAAEAQGLISGVITGSKTLIRSCAAAGMRMICCDSDTRLLCAGLQNNMRELTAL